MEKIICIDPNNPKYMLNQISYFEHQIYSLKNDKKTINEDLMAIYQMSLTYWLEQYKQL